MRGLRADQKALRVAAEGECSAMLLAAASLFALRMKRESCSSNSLMRPSPALTLPLPLTPPLWKCWLLPVADTAAAAAAAAPFRPAEDAAFEAVWGRLNSANCILKNVIS